jgi:hypothetical protein
MPIKVTAVYRPDELFLDLRTDEVFELTRKRGAERSKIVLPNEAATKASIGREIDRRSAIWRMSPLMTPMAIG